MPSAPFHRPALPKAIAGLLALAMASALSACGGVVPPALPSAVPAGWAHAPAAPAAPGAAAPDLRSWWKNLGDPALVALVDQALAQNLDIAVARSRLRQANTLALRGNAPYQPSLSAGVHTLQDVTATDSFLHASLDVTWELGLFGMREGAQQVAKAGLDSSEAALQATRVSTVAEVVHQYLALRAAQQQVALLGRLAALDARAAELAAVRVRTHLAAAGDGDEAAARKAQTAALLPGVRQSAVQAAQALAVLTGRDTPDAAWNLPAPQPVLGPVAVAELPADLVRVRPDVRQAEAAVLQAAGELGMSRAELYPRIALGASYLFSYNLTQNRRTTTAATVPAAGPQIDIPLFDWGLRKARADARGEALQAALLSYRQTVLEGLSEAETALSALSLQGTRVAALDDAAAALQRRARGQRSLLAQGLSSEYEQVALDRAALQAEAERSGALASQALAFVTLYKALGGAPLPTAADVLPDAAPVASAQEGRP